MRRDEKGGAERARSRAAVGLPRCADPLVPVPIRVRMAVERLPGSAIRWRSRAGVRERMILGLDGTGAANEHECDWYLRLWLRGSPLPPTTCSVSIVSPPICYGACSTPHLSCVGRSPRGCPLTLKTLPQIFFDLVFGHHGPKIGVHETTHTQRFGWAVVQWERRRSPSRQKFEVVLRVRNLSIVLRHAAHGSTDCPPL